MRLLTLVVVGSGLILLMLGGIFLGKVAVSRAVVNCDDSSGLVPHPLVWSAGRLPKRRRIADIVRDVALLPGPLHLWDLVGLVFLLLLFLLKMSVFGRTLLIF